MASKKRNRDAFESDNTMILRIRLPHWNGSTSSLVKDMKSLSVSTAVPSSIPLKAPPQASTSLFDLPQEIQDIIFDLAYPREADFKIIDKKCWEETQKNRGREGLSVLPFPKPKPCEWMVSKRFFVAAARAFVGNQVYDVKRMRLTHSFGCTFSYAVFGSGIVGAFLRSAVVEWWWSSFPEVPPKLTSLTIMLPPTAFESVEPKYAWRESYGATEFRMCMLDHGLNKLSGLQEFHLAPKTCSYAKTEAQETVWRSNVLGFEEFLRPHVTRPREASTRSGHGTELYLNSKVQIDSSFLISPAQDGLLFGSASDNALLAQASLFGTPPASRPTSRLTSPRSNPVASGDKVVVPTSAPTYFQAPNPVPIRWSFGNMHTCETPTTFGTTSSPKNTSTTTNLPATAAARKAHGCNIPGTSGSASPSLVVRLRLPVAVTNLRDKLHVDSSDGLGYECYEFQLATEISNSDPTKANRKLNNQDVPQGLEELKAMLGTDGESVMQWINALRRRSERPSRA